MATEERTSRDVSKVPKAVVELSDASEFAAALTPLFLADPFDTEHEQGIAPQLRRSGIGARDIRRWCWR
jgi:hypothetical protein